MGSARMFAPRRLEKNPIERLASLPWGIVFLMTLIAGIGVGILYSVGGGNMNPWASAHVMRYGLAFAIMLIVSVIDIRVWMALAYPAWVTGVVMLLAVKFVGSTGMGGQRWLDLYVMRIQPSELMKIAVVMALARYFHGRDFFQSKRLQSLLVPALIMGLPMILIVTQPDLGTGLMVIFAGAAILLMAGLPVWLFVVAGIVSAAAVPVAWQFLKPYQQDRVLIFLNPESDPLGAGYQITQSKIALGSGGLMGKGFLEGTQSQLKFLPEMKTDFIFTVLAEEFGLVGALVLLMLYMGVLSYALFMAFGCRHQFGRLLAGGLSVTLFLYVMINVSMVMGLMPVVGVPLPLVSYGGSAMLTWMIAFGLIFSVSISRHVALAPKGSGIA